MLSLLASFPVFSRQVPGLLDFSDASDEPFWGLEVQRPAKEELPFMELLSSTGLYLGSFIHPFYSPCKLDFIIPILWSPELKRREAKFLARAHPAVDMQHCPLSCLYVNTAAEYHPMEMQAP